MSVSGEPPSRRDDDASLPLLAQRLEALERRVDSGFAHLDSRLDSLGFVRSDVYAERNAALRIEIEHMKEDIAEVRREAPRPGRWALGLFASTLLTGIIAVILQIASQVGGG